MLSDLNIAPRLRLPILNKVAGRDVEITIRGDREFTFSYDMIDEIATAAICDFFKASNYKKLSVETDEECGTFIYLDL